MLGPDDRLVPNTSEVAGEVIEGEAIIIDLASGVYYSMTGAGGLLWALLEEGRSLGAAAAAIAARYDVPVGQARADVERVAAELLHHGLVVRGGAGRPRGPPPRPARVRARLRDAPASRLPRSERAARPGPARARPEGHSLEGVHDRSRMSPQVATHRPTRANASPG